MRTYTTQASGVTAEVTGTVKDIDVEAKTYLINDKPIPWWHFVLRSLELEGFIKAEEFDVVVRHELKHPLRREE